MNDFTEQYEEESRYLSKKDYKEIERIRMNPEKLIVSYLFSKIEPFLLPYYERREK